MPEKGSRKMNAVPHIVIIGGGFGGLYTAQHLKRAPARITLIDRRNFHLFQPPTLPGGHRWPFPGQYCRPLAGHT